MSIVNGNTDIASNAPRYKILDNSSAFGNTLYDNVTVGAFVSNAAVGVFAANNKGWQVITQGTGYINSVSLSGGINYSNAETFTISGGTVNATGYVTTNATGNLVSGTLTKFGSGFTNTFTFAFDGAKSLSNLAISVAGNTYNNTDIVTFSNGISNGTASIGTNANGGITSITVTKPGAWSNTTTNTQVVVSFSNSSGGNSSGNGATITVGLIAGSNGVSVVNLGGRAGRIMKETLVSMGSLIANNTNIP